MARGLGARALATVTFLLATGAGFVLLLGSPAAPEPAKPQPQPTVGLDGLLEVRLSDGSVVTTHGQDPPIEGKAQADCLLGLICIDPSPSPSPTPTPTPGPTNVQCVADGGYRFVAVMAHRGSVPSAADTEARSAIASAQSFLDSEAAEHGGEVRMRFACRNGAVDVRHVNISGANDTFGGVVSKLKEAGLNRSTEKYVVFAKSDRGGGQASINGDSSNSLSNRNNVGPDWAVVYDSDLANLDWRWASMLHEIGHNLGAVQNDSPDSSGGWHCDGSLSQDVMCYNDGGSNWDSNHSCGTPERRHFDSCHNDFFHPAPSGGYLATHWNLASCHVAGRWFELGRCAR
ncbi:MAG: hypothetical protein M3276_00680 [Actinomycetota bacterium]|nr:hypothetical protein [Actinomycetota bacterium]